MKQLLLTLLLVLVAVAAVQAYQGGCPGQGHYQDFMSGLTPEQQQKVQQLTDAHHEQLFALQKEIKTKHEAMETLFAATPVDKAAVDKAVAELNDLQAKKAQLNADYRLALTEATGKPVPMESGRPCGAGTSGKCGASAGCPGAQGSGATSSGAKAKGAGTPPCCADDKKQ